jgi:hypothetical protein
MHKLCVMVMQNAEAEGRNKKHAKKLETRNKVKVKAKGIEQ